MSTPAGSHRTGRILVGLGLVVIVASVLYVLEAANGPGAGPTTFAERRSYNQVKVAVHHTFPQAFVAGLGGVGLVMWGARLLQRDVDPSS